MNSKKALENIVINFDNMGMICSNLGYEEFYAKDLYFKEVFKTEYESIKKDLDKLEILKEKATPKRPVTIKPEGKSIFDYPTNRIKCPACGVQLPMKKNCLKKKNPINYCNRCGQKLDWSDVDE